MRSRPFSIDPSPEISRWLPPRAGLLAALIGSALVLGGCSSRLGNFTGSLSSLGRGGEAAPAAGPLGDLARRYDAKPGAKQPSLDYAAALRANGQHPQAVAVLQRASVVNIGDRDISAAYGMALADVGRFEEAVAVLNRAHTEDRPNWRVLSSLGSIADQTGDHVRAREYYHRALQLAPDEPIVLNNLGLSYLLTKEMRLAEETLRKAAGQPGANPKIRGNLALAMRLQGKAAEATAVEIQGVAPARAPAKVVSMRVPAGKAESRKTESTRTALPGTESLRAAGAPKVAKKQSTPLKLTPGE